MRSRTIFSVLSFFALLLASVPTYAGIPVIDVSNLMQNIITAMHEVTETEQQIKQYETQLEQYQAAVTNMENAPQFLWNNANQAISGLLSKVQTVDMLKNSEGSIASALSQHFGDIGKYSISPCFSVSGCSSSEWAAIQDSKELGSQMEQQAISAALQSLGVQENGLTTDAQHLASLQSAAQGASGRMAAIQYATQFASTQAGQLMKIRGLLVAQQQMVAARDEAQANAEAIKTAGDNAFNTWNVPETTPKKW